MELMSKILNQKLLNGTIKAISSQTFGKMLENDLVHAAVENCMIDISLDGFDLLVYLQSRGFKL